MRTCKLSSNSYGMAAMVRVVIVGAGPAGASTALLLAQRGIRITLLEKETAFERIFRGEGLMPAGLGALHEMGLQEVYDHQVPSRQLTSWDFYVGTQRRMRVVEPMKNGLATQIMDQGALLSAIVNKAKDLPNFEFYSGWQVTELLKEGEKVVGVKANCESEKREFIADCVIACDGRYSRLRKLAGLDIERSDAQFDVLWFRLPAPASLTKETPFVACLQPRNQFAFYPSWDEQLQIGWIVEKSSSAHQKITELKTKDWCEVFAQALPDEWASHFRENKSALVGPIYLDVQVGCAQQWSAPGLLLIGDAAHPMAPNRAQGINMALRDAIVVANHLAPQASTDSCSADSLAAIQSEREPEIKAIQKMQLAEWRKVAFISTPGLPYWGFKAIATAFGRFTFAQNIWLHEQTGLREGVTTVKLNKSL
ncbi:MAG: FAD-dependent oxidoreductase [Cyanobacteria bacterium P01_D01_bin.105]